MATTFAARSPAFTSWITPGATRQDSGLIALLGSTPHEHGQIAFNQIGGIKAGVCGKSGVHLWRNFNEHDHSLLFALRDIEAFEVGAFDWQHGSSSA